MNCCCKATMLGHVNCQSIILAQIPEALQDGRKAARRIPYPVLKAVKKSRKTH